MSRLKFIDLFSGTGVVANTFNSNKVKIITNDLLYSNYVIAKSFLETKKDFALPIKM